MWEEELELFFFFFYKLTLHCHLIIKKKKTCGENEARAFYVRAVVRHFHSACVHSLHGVIAQCREVTSYPVASGSFYTQGPVIIPSLHGCEIPAGLAFDGTLLSFFFHLFAALLTSRFPSCRSKWRTSRISRTSSAW